MEELWKGLIYNNIDYSDKYLISNHGRVKNIKTGYIRNFILYKGASYYHMNILSNGKNVTIRIHRAVAQNFIPNPNNLPTVNHKDGDKLNNHVDNLEWVTYKENNIHAVIMNLIKSGEDVNKTKLTQEQVDYIKAFCIPGDSEFGCAALGRKFNVDSSTISKIVHNHSWKCYTNEYKQIINN